MQRWNGFLLIVALLVSSGAAGVLALQRLRVERANRTVELVMDYEDIATLASTEGKTVSGWLKGFSTPLSVALTEGTLNTWGIRLQEKGRPVFLLSEPRYQQAKAMLALKSRVRLEAPDSGQGVVVRSESGAQFFVEGDPGAIAEMGIGIDPEAAQGVLQAGHTVVARLTNQPNLTPLAIRGALLRANEQGASLVIFAGDQVLGFRNQVETTAQAIRASGMRYGSIEFGKQGGDAKLTQLLIDRTVRVHSVSAGESLTLSPQELVERFERAVQERNIRVVYLRMAGGDATSLRQLIQALGRVLARSGYTIARSGARPFRPLEPPAWLFPLVGLGVGVLTGWVLWQFRRAWGWAPLVLGVGVALLCLLPIGRKGVALATAILFPTVGLVVLPGFVRGSPWLALPIPFGWSLLGALHIVGLLAESPFLIKADQFLGVKVAHVLPLLLVAGFYCAYAVGRWQFWRDWLGRPVLWGQLAVMGVVVGALGLMLMRTGNEAPGAVSEWELRFRALLEQVMNVRPRTKEFLIGHPALVVALGLLSAGRREWLPLAMLLGAIGQVSLVNTFCHLHSPLEVSLMRTLWGILIGLLLGAIVWGLVRRNWTAVKGNG
ncbi:MAG: DUF5693 family protein [Armatimonadetes bacterium]|nr:DUF5693 family protein [Armatimonadota bacterium]CUU36624.1 hypothetical protein DCOP10_11895 [Armatimonadetes bacterium DC]